MFHLDHIVNIDSFAHQILRSKALQIGGVSHPLVEIELYLWTLGHTDPFSHRNPLQKEPGRWHFHMQGGTYRGGTYKGLDVTFSLLQSMECYGGLLIRSIQLPGGSVLEGPCRVVDYILEKTGSASILDLVKKMNSPSATDDKNPFFLHDQPRYVPIYASPRVGLTLKRFTDDKPEYLMRPYRYVTHLKLKKNKNLITLALYQSGLHIKEISELTGTSESVIQRYISQFKDGRERKRSIDEFRGNLSVSDLSYMCGYLLK